LLQDTKNIRVYFAVSKRLRSQNNNTNKLLNNSDVLLSEKKTRLTSC